VAEYLSEEEQLAQLKSWWQRYGWWLLAGVVIGLGGYFLLQYFESSRAATNAAASEVFERYQEAPADEQAAKPLLARLDGEFAGTAYHIMSLMTRAQLASESGDIEAAVGFYSQAAQGDGVEHLSDVARLRLARALQQQGRSDEAITALGAVEGEGYRSLVAELKGDILYAQGDTGGAREAYAAAVEAQGENPRTLLSMKLKNLSAPEGATSALESPSEPETDANELNEDQLEESETEAETVDQAAVDSQAEVQLNSPAEPQAK